MLNKIVFNPINNSHLLDLSVVLLIEMSCYLFTCKALIAQNGLSYDNNHI